MSMRRPSGVPSFSAVISGFMFVSFVPLSMTSYERMTRGLAPASMM